MPDFGRSELTIMPSGEITWKKPSAIGVGHGQSSTARKTMTMGDFQLINNFSQQLLSFVYSYEFVCLCMSL